jgi:hypothetical protein
MIEKSVLIRYFSTQNPFNMKSWLTHGVYLTVIIFLTYQYYLSAQMAKALPYLEQQLQASEKVINARAEQLHREVQKQGEAYRNPYNMAMVGQANTCVEQTRQIISILNQYRVRLDSGGKSIDAAAIKSFKTALQSYQDTLMRTIDPRDKIVIDTQMGIIKLLNDVNYWQILEKLPRNGAATALNALQNQVACAEVDFLNYLFNRVVGSIFCGFNPFRLVITPQKFLPLQGDNTEFELYLASYSSNPGSGVQFKVNGKYLGIKEGVAQFKSTNETVGMKKIVAEATITNPITKEVKTVKSVFEYEVFPKCRRDCQ